MLKILGVTIKNLVAWVAQICAPWPKVRSILCFNTDYLCGPL